MELYMKFYKHPSALYDPRFKVLARIIIEDFESRGGVAFEANGGIANELVQQARTILTYQQDT